MWDGIWNWRPGGVGGSVIGVKGYGCVTPFSASRVNIISWRGQGSPASETERRRGEKEIRVCWQESGKRYRHVPGLLSYPAKQKHRTPFAP